MRRGSNGIVLNDLFTGKATLVLAIGTDGRWFAMIQNSTMKSLNFAVYLRLLEKLTAGMRDNQSKIPVVMLDNARTHCSEL